MKINITWFRDSGKYYTSGDVEIEEGTYIWSPDFKQQLVNNQNVMADGWQNSDYYVLTQDTPESEAHGGFFYRLFPQGSFKGIIKAETWAGKEKRVCDDLREFQKEFDSNPEMQKQAIGNRVE